MKWERMILIAFLGNYLVNNIAAGLASLVPSAQGGNPIFSAQYLTFVVLAAIVTAGMAWWFLSRMPREKGLNAGLIFGALGFVTAVVTAFVTGVAGVLLQTGSIAQVGQVLPNFGPYLVNWTTLVLALVWVIPGALIGFVAQKRMSAPAASPMSTSGGQTM